MLLIVAQFCFLDLAVPVLHGIHLISNHKIKYQNTCFSKICEVI